MNYEVRVRLILWNSNAVETNFEEVKLRLGIEAPDKLWRRGDRLDQRTQRTRNDDGIMYYISRTFNSDPVDEVRKVLNILAEKGPSAERIFAQNDSELSIVARVYLENDADELMNTPSFHMPADVVRAMGRYGMEFDFDLYVLDT